MEEGSPERLAEIRKDCEANYPPVRYGAMLVDVAGECDLDWVRVLLELGAEVDSRDSAGQTALLAACCNPDSEGLQLVEYLLEQGCDIHAVDDDQWSALRHAARHGSRQICDRLLAAGANVDHQDAKQKTPLLETVAMAEYSPEQNLPLVSVFLAVGADPNLAASDGETPIRLASKLGLLDAVTELLDAGALVDGAPDAKSPLTVAALAGRKEIVALLLERGADVQGAPERWETPLMMAVSSSDDDSVESITSLLLSRGAEVNATRRKGTALRSAVKKQRESIVKLLLEHGADPSVDDEVSKPLLEFAREKSSAEIVRLLESASG